jgi:hypothetical protein
MTCNQDNTQYTLLSVEDKRINLKMKMTPDKILEEMKKMISYLKNILF